MCDMSFEFPDNQEAVQIEFDCKGHYGESVGSIIVHDFTSSEIPQGTFELDGYIDTAQGQFAFQGNVEDAKKAILQIKEYMQVPVLRKELEELSNKLVSKEQEMYRYSSQGEDNFDRWTEIKQEKETLDKEKTRLKQKIQSFENSVSSYKI